jgi:hypothetical protein
MSVQAMTRVMEHSQTRGVTRLVLLVIANHETEDRGAFPAIDRLAREAGSGVRTVQECIRRAEAAGELEVRYRQGPHGTNLYRVLSGLAATATLPGTESTRLRTPQNPHPADMRRESAPERKEQGLGSSTALTSSHPSVSAATRPRDAIADTLARIEGGNPLEVPPSHMRTLCVKANELRKVAPDVTPAEVERRARNWSGHMHDATISGPAVVKHWARLASPARVGPATNHPLDRMARDLIEGVSANGDRGSTSSGAAPVGELPRVAGE